MRFYLQLVLPCFQEPLNLYLQVKPACAPQPIVGVEEPPWAHDIYGAKLCSESICL